MLHLHPGPIVRGWKQRPQQSGEAWNNGTNLPAPLDCLLLPTLPGGARCLVVPSGFEELPGSFTPVLEDSAAAT